MPIKPPVIPKEKFDCSKMGPVGTFGAGGNAYIRFIQTALTPNELKKTTLIQNIIGSETWDVKDLFQRDVDEERVQKSIMPYLQDPNSVKFFNPLTLLLLPMKSGSVDQTESRLVYSPSTVKEAGDFNYEVVNNSGHYEYSHCKEESAYSRLDWQSSTTKLVAIDGQHRLNALSRTQQSDPSFLSGWSIPVIIIGIFQEDCDQEAPDLLEVVRKIFLNINTEAKEVNQSRSILLNDESVNSVCVQALVQEAHSNDCKLEGDRNRLRLPLLYFDWRGATKNLIPDPGPCSMKSLVELNNWFEHYLLGEDGTARQENALGLDDLDDPISIYQGKGNKLSPKESAVVRENFTSGLFLGLCHLFETFKPYELYIFKIRKLETELTADSDIARYAFNKLRFGTHRAPDEIHRSVEDFYSRDLVQKEIPTVKAGIHTTIEQDIGMRAVMFAFGNLKKSYDEAVGETSSWIRYSEWFVKSLNEIYRDDWFRGPDELEDGTIAQGKKSVLLKYISHNGSGMVDNYRLDHQKKGLGAFLSMLIVKYGEVLSGTLLSETIDYHCDELEPSLTKGFKREATLAVKQEKMSLTMDETKKEIKERTTSRVKMHMEKIRKYFEGS